MRTHFEFIYESSNQEFRNDQFINSKHISGISCSYIMNYIGSCWKEKQIALQNKHAINKIYSWLEMHLSFLYLMWVYVEKKHFKLLCLKVEKSYFLLSFQPHLKISPPSRYFEALIFFIVISVVFHIVIRSSALTCWYFEDTLISCGLDNTET